MGSSSVMLLIHVAMTCLPPFCVSIYHFCYTCVLENLDFFLSKMAANQPAWLNLSVGWAFVELQRYKS
jgi:hypothetical protein